MKDKLYKFLDIVRAPQQLVSENVFSKYQSMKKLIIIITIIGIIVWLNIGTIAEFIVSSDKIKSEIEETLSERFGSTVKIRGEVKFFSRPEPNVVIDDVIVTKNGDPNNIIAEILNIKGQTTLSAIFYGSHNFDKVKINDVKLNVDVTNQDSNFLSFLKDSDLEDNGFDIKNLTINSYKENQINPNSKVIRSIHFKSFQIDPNPSEGDYIIKGSFDDDKLGDQYYFSLNLEDGLDQQTDYDFKLYSDNSEIISKGEIAINKNLSISGELNGYFSGLTGNLALRVFGDKMVNSLKFDDKSIVSGNFKYANKQLQTNNISFKSPTAEYNFDIKAKISDEIEITLNLNVPKFQHKSLFKTREEFLANKTVIEIQNDFQKRLENFFLFSVQDDVNFIANINIPKISLKNGAEGSFQLASRLKDKVFFLDSFKLDLPGDSKFRMASKVKIDRDKKTLSGSLEFLGYGKDLGKLNESLNIDSKEKDYSVDEFYVKSKAYIYEKKVHFREIVAQLNKDRLAGQLLVDYSEKFSATSALNFQNIEIDNYFKNNNAEDQSNYNIANQLDFIRSFDSFFDELNLSLSSKVLTKSGYKLKDLSMYVKIYPGIVDIIDSFFYTDRFGDFRGKARIDISEFQPKINMDLKLEKFDIDYLIYEAKNKDNDRYIADGNWSDSKINLQKLSTILGNFRFSIDNLKIAHFDLVDFRTELEMNGDKVKVGQSRFEVFNSKVGFEGNFTTEYPSFGFKYEASELDFKMVLNSFFGVNSVLGKFNSTGVISSTGYTYSELISKLNGRINIVSNGLQVKGFDLASYSLALSKIVRVEQVEIISEELLNTGATNFGYLGTSILLSAGKLRFNNAKLKSEYAKDFNISGIIDIANWDLNINTEISVLTADNQEVPVSAVTRGKITDRKMDWDYSAARKYWEQKFYGGQIF